MSPERVALIDTCKEKSAGLAKQYEARVYKSDLTMPYRLFRPTASGKLLLVLYLHGSGGLGDGARLALGIIDGLCRELAIDERRIYVTGQSMDGAGTWHMTAQRPKLFAAAVACCAAQTAEDPTASIGTPLWNFHGAADKSVAVALSRDRIAAMRKAGGHSFYTEYPGVDHNVWEWAYTEPELVNWVFAQPRAS